MASSNDVTPLASVPANIKALLTRLHARSSEQEAAIPASTIQAVRESFASDSDRGRAAMDALMLDKFIALDEDKSHFMYNLLRATRATTVVEIGTSFGVSTIYLALAVAENAKRYGKKGFVLATEKEAPKAAVARAHWKEAGSEVENSIKLLEGDLTETLADESNLPTEDIDFILFDSKF